MTAQAGNGAGDDFRGDVAAFDRAWRARAETGVLHWAPEPPRNQVQLAFRSHWRLFQELMGPEFGGKRVLEVGAGRGSMSAHFAEAGFECTLLDSSPAVMHAAAGLFARYGLAGRFLVGDTTAIPFPDGSFDVVVSIGLLEHFRDPAPALQDQVRILAPGGLFLGYVVPEIPDNVQKEYEWINRILEVVAPVDSAGAAGGKEALYRSDELSESYLKILRNLPLDGLQASGVYPLPMISPSIRFPFTLLPPSAEEVLVNHLLRMLEDRAREYDRNPWLCDETHGQAFLVWGWRK
ncbi:MAG: class I SAM-dependent methyltransferase [Gemmatimonadota bacterium]